MHYFINGLMKLKKKNHPSQTFPTYYIFKFTSNYSSPSSLTDVGNWLKTILKFTFSFYEIFIIIISLVVDWQNLVIRSRFMRFYSILFSSVHSNIVSPLTILSLTNLC